MNNGLCSFKILIAPKWFFKVGIVHYEPPVKEVAYYDNCPYVVREGTTTKVIYSLTNAGMIRKVNGFINKMTPNKEENKDE